MKTCTKCEVEKDLQEFSNDTRSKKDRGGDGKQSKCNRSINKYNKIE